MEQRLTDLQRHRSTVSAFGDLAAAMRGVAAARAQHARRLIAGVDAYAGTVAMAMAQARALLPPGTGAAEAATQAPVLWVLIGGEQGFNAGFSERVLNAAPQALGGRVLLLGTKLLRLAQARGCRPEWSAPMIAHAEAATDTADALHRALATALASRPAGGVELVGAESADELHGGEIVVRRRRLLPIEPDAADGVQVPAGPAPCVHMPPARLLDELAFEHLAAQLVRAVLHGHAAECLARLRAMSAAEKNVERMLQSLDGEMRRRRQEAITAEIVELAAALRSSS